MGGRNSPFEREDTNRFNAEFLKASTGIRFPMANHLDKPWVFLGEFKAEDCGKVHQHYCPVCYRKHYVDGSIYGRIAPVRLEPVRFAENQKPWQPTTCFWVCFGVCSLCETAYYIRQQPPYEENVLCP